ncbi:MAG: hypothetical protein SFX73_40695 [Kofleriaceae bacterium]|nr:hypothetical protein [Kofleriaceae bacterium]
MSKPDDYLWDGSGSPDPEVARLETLLAPLAHDGPLDELKLRRPRKRGPWILGAVIAAAAAAVLVVWLDGRTSSTPTVDEREVSCRSHDPAAAGMAFVTHGGQVACGERSAESGVLPIGGTLDTGANRASLTIGTIGTAELFEGTRVRLDRTDVSRHQLHLERGRMHARVVAPPRIFAITTPSTSIVDLGCEYTIEIDVEGRGSIVVQSGMVELEGTGGVVVAPAGTTTRLLAGRQPSLPLTDDARPELRAAVADFETKTAGALDRIVQRATDRDAITLIALAELAPADRRAEVLTRLAAAVVPPAGVSIEGAASNPDQRGKWREDVIRAHFTQLMLRESPGKKY